MLKIRRSTLAAVATTFGVLACAAPAAHAGFVSFQPFVPGDLSAGLYNYSADVGEASNDLTVQKTGPFANEFMSFVDANYVIVAGANCTQLPAGQAQCPRAITGSRFVVRMRDGDDRARVFVPAGVPEVYGGAGDDDLASDTFGTGARVYGDGGDDRVASSGDGGALADGGSGNDRVRCCGGQDGGTAIGGSGSDLINAFPGSFGVVNSDGGTGNDTIVSRPATFLPGPTTIDGGDGNDVIAVHGSSDRAAPHTITGGTGDDTIVGSQYDDTIDAGDGRDFVDVLGGGTDTVACGPGDNDVVRYDPTDVIAGDCEVRLAPDGTVVTGG